jgi:hypothetical protein
MSTTKLEESGEETEDEDFGTEVRRAFTLYSVSFDALESMPSLTLQKFWLTHLSRFLMSLQIPQNS